MVAEITTNKYAFVEAQYLEVARAGTDVIVQNGIFVNLPNIVGFMCN